MAAATQELKNSIQVKLEQSGEYDRCAPPRGNALRDSLQLITCVPCVRRLKEHLRQKLIDSGWRDNLKEYTMGAPPARPDFWGTASQLPNFVVPCRNGVVPSAHSLICMCSRRARPQS